MKHLARGDLFRLGAIILAIAISALFYPRWSLNHDTSWYLVATRLFLNGMSLYDYIGEVNPPLSFYLTIAPLRLADAFGISDSAAFAGYVLLLALLALLWCAHLLSKAAISERQRWGLTLGLIAATLVVPIGNFGQREHLMLILTAPCFMSVILRERRPAPSLPHGIAMGIAAATGLALKPYFYFAPATLALLILFRSRRLRDVLTPANITIAACTLGYALAVLWLHPAYLEKMIPIARIAYGAYGKTPQEVLLVPALAAVAAILIIMLKRRAAIDDVARYILAIALGFLVCYVWQFKGWTYQLLPFMAYALLFAVWLAATMRIGRPDRLMAAALMICALVTLGDQLRRGPYQARLQPHFARYVEVPATPILVLSTNVSAAFPFVNAVNARWTSRYPTQWLPPGALHAWRNAGCPQPGTRCAEIGRVIALARSTTVDDLLRNQPTLVFIDERSEKPYFGRQRFDYLAFLARDPRFGPAWRAYRLEGREAGYSIWRRRSTGAPRETIAAH